MNKYNPEIHKRHSIRLKNYDYSREGLYFITICCKNREPLFGEIVDGEMILNDIGEMANDEWMKTPTVRGNVILHHFVVMPNHFHAIVEITHRDNDGTGVLHTPNNINNNCKGVLHTPPDNGDGVLHMPNDNVSHTPNDTNNNCTGVLLTPNNINNPNNNEGVCNTPLRSPSQTLGAIVRGYKSVVSKNGGIFGLATQLPRTHHPKRKCVYQNQ